jgi:3-hydroxyisobutyrate dehydrogenase-like beta-hydroxyacid dehydrogenase
MASGERRQRLGFIGLGNIGGAIAANLVADGHAVAVHDVDAARVRALAEKGAAAAGSVAAVARASETTFLSLPTPSIMESVALEWLEAAAPDAVLVDLTTNAPDTVRRVGERVAAAGRHLLECPLTGGAPGAKARMLVFIAGGDAAVFERCAPLLQTIGRAAFHLGPLGAGSVGKLVNSLWAFTTTWVSLEGLAVCAKSGIDLRTMIEMVRTAGGGNIFVSHMVEGLNQRGRPTEFALELAAKDAGLLIDVARELSVPAPVAAEVAQALVTAKSLGFGDRDFTDLVEVIERLAGVKLHLPPPRTSA